MSKDFEFKYRASSVVLVGELDALTHTPKTLEACGILSSDDVKKSEVKQVSKDYLFASFTWFDIQVSPIDATQRKLVLILTDHGYKSEFLDLVSSVLNLNYNAKASAIGLNFTCHIQHKSSKKWHEFGHKLVPIEHWRQTFGIREESSHIGMRALSMKLENVLPQIVEDTGAEPTELNIDVKPLGLDHNQNKVKNYSELSFNYHFPISSKRKSKGNPIELALLAIDTHFLALLDQLDDSIITLLDC